LLFILGTITNMNYVFKNAQGLKLAGKFYSPSGSGPFPTVVFAHGFDSSKDSPRSIPLASALAEDCIACFLFDFTGHGESEGTKEASTIEQQTCDLKAAVDFIRMQPKVDETRLALHGSSSGCLVVLNLCLFDKRPRTAVLRAPRTDGYLPTVKGQAAMITIPLYFIQGENDPLLEETKDFYGSLQTESELVVVPGADHLFTEPVHLDEVIELSTNWFEEKLHLEEKAA